MMQLSNLLPAQKIASDCTITGLCLHSANVQTGDVFIALSPRSDYISEALAKGAAAVLYPAERTAPSAVPVPCVAVPALAQQLGHIAAAFYQYPSRGMTIIGITGTNGKTTCTHLLAQALNQLGRPCATIGTLGVRYKKTTIQETGLTTPDPIHLQSALAELKAQGITTVAMEVSSHALSQYRVNGVDFTGAVFTNLTQDHLDYHLTMSAYLAEKCKLFQMPGLKFCVLNVTDPAVTTIARTLAPTVTCYGYSHNLAMKAYLPLHAYTQALQRHTHGMQGQLVTQAGQQPFKTALLGDFNVANTLAVVGVLEQLGYALPVIAQTLPTLHPVAGRMACWGGTSTPLVVIDYAHTPDALKQALCALKPYVNGKLWCVFGCGGDRDASKRSQMGAIASEWADHIIVTNDNPRHECPQQIVEAIMSGIPSANQQKVTIMLAREQAIHTAIAQAALTDVILVAGKGHECYQIIGSEKTPFSDAACVKAAIGV